jgi:hypothetical protein
VNGVWKEMTRRQTNKRDVKAVEERKYRSRYKRVKGKKNE